ncbi:MAG: ubiquinol-cytochrome c reductase iron-sulfur subunit, partial [Candidatus Binatia bacterium]
RRDLLKFFLALPFVKLLENYLAPLLGLGSNTAMAATPLKVAKVSELKQPWSSARFTYRLKVQTKDVYKKDVVTEESLPGLVIRLPDELAEKKGGGMKGKFSVVNLHCSHERCVTAYITDKSEIRAVSSVEAKNPVAYCPCHRSVFDLAEGGKAIKGPAKEPLWKFDFDVKGDDVIVTGVDPKASVWEPGRPGGLTVEYPVRPGEPGL